jgi:hypothetical protein
MFKIMYFNESKMFFCFPVDKWSIMLARVTLIFWS